MSRLCVELETVWVIMPPEQQELFWEAVRILLGEEAVEGFLVVSDQLSVISHQFESAPASAVQNGGKE